VIQPGDSKTFTIKALTNNTDPIIMVDSLIADLTCFSQTLAVFRLETSTANVIVNPVEWHNIPAGVESSKTLLITNAGNVDAIINSIDWNDKVHFTGIKYISFPYHLSAGTSVEVTVDYKPSAFNQFNTDTAIITVDTILHLYSAWNGYSADSSAYQAMLISPANTSTGIAVDTLLTWGDLIGINSYKLNIGNDINFTSMKLDTIVNSTKYMAVFDPNTMYYWRVRGYVDNYSYLWSDTWSFTTGIGAGIGDNQSKNSTYLYVIPNPASSFGRIIFSTDLNDQVNLSMTNILGLQVFSTTNVTLSDHYGYLDYNFSDLLPGMYFLMLQCGKTKTVCGVCVIR
jgi:opacity protein-like surface antigen